MTRPIACYKKAAAHAMQYTGMNLESLREWCLMISEHAKGYISVYTHTGFVPIGVGDWVVREKNKYMTYSDKSFHNIYHTEQK